MAFPVPDSYSCASGQDIYAGRSRAPSWVQAIAQNEWGIAPNSTFSTSGAGWSGASPGGTGTYQQVVLAYSGGVLNTVGITYGGVFIPGTFVILFGGGHNDWAGNDMYAYGPLESETPIWRRLTDPTIPAPSDVARLNGYPVSRHTYDTLVYVPTLNKMVCVSTVFGYPNANSYAVVDVFDFAVDPESANPWSTLDTGYPSTLSRMTGYNPVTGKVWGLGVGNGTNLAALDIATLTWTSYAKNNPTQNGAGPYTKAAIDTAHNLFAFIDQSASVRVQDLNSPTSALYAPTVTGTGPTTGNQVLDWDEANGRFVSWGRSGKTLYFLTPGANPYSGGDAWTWTSTTPSGGATPAAENTTGVQGRFRVKNDSWKGVVVMPTSNQPIYFYRM